VHTIKPKGLCLGLGFQFFEYLGFGFGYFINELYNLKKKKIFLIFQHGFEYKFKKIEKNQN
jgi:hypothetical protein